VHVQHTRERQCAATFLVQTTLFRLGRAAIFYLALRPSVAFSRLVLSLLDTSSVRAQNEQTRLAVAVTLHDGVVCS